MGPPAVAALAAATGESALLRRDGAAMLLPPLCAASRQDKGVSATSSSPRGRARHRRRAATFPRSPACSSSSVDNRHLDVLIVDLRETVKTVSASLPGIVAAELAKYFATHMLMAVPGMEMGTGMVEPLSMSAEPMRAATPAHPPSTCSTLRKAWTAWPGMSRTTATTAPPTQASLTQSSPMMSDVLELAGSSTSDAGTLPELPPFPRAREPPQAENFDIFTDDGNVDGSDVEPAEIAKLESVVVEPAPTSEAEPRDEEIPIETLKFPVKFLVQEGDSIGTMLIDYDFDLKLKSFHPMGYVQKVVSRKTKAESKRFRIRPAYSAEDIAPALDMESRIGSLFDLGHQEPIMVVEVSGLESDDGCIQPFEAVV